MLLGDCHSPEDVRARKDHQVAGILQQLESRVEAWDSGKCAPVR
jgi:hypothetical protein